MLRRLFNFLLPVVVLFILSIIVGIVMLAPLAIAGLISLLEGWLFYFTVALVWLGGLGFAFWKLDPFYIWHDDEEYDDCADSFDCVDSEDVY